MLTDLNGTLLQLEKTPGDDELVNRAFRAMHTLKGSGATAGFKRMAHFVHHVEEVFDRVRNHQLEASSTLIDAALSACDCCLTLLDLGSEDSETPVPLEQEVLASIEAYLPKATAGKATRHNAKAASVGTNRYKIGFTPHRQIFFSGTDPATLIFELSDLGKIEVRCNVAELLECDAFAFDPEQCYLSWEIELETDRPEDDIREIFRFVDEDCGFVVEPLPSGEPEPQAAPPEPPTAFRATDPGGSTAAQSIRVDSAKLDALLRLTGELLVVRGAFPSFANRVEAGESPKLIAAEMRAAGAKFSRLADDLQNTVMSIRMLPVRQVFQRFPRLIRDIQRSLDKSIELHIAGEDTTLDKTVIDSIGDPLTHIIRNAADHGIESTADRLALGKPEAGRIDLKAYARGSNVVLEIRDDGKGMDPDKLRQRALERKLYPEPAILAMDDAAALKIIFAPGFSTVDQVTDLSGRGVGMDVVRTVVQALNGTIQIESVVGKGTTFRIELPASMLVSKGILVAVAGQQVVLPMDSIRSMVKIPAAAMHAFKGHRMAHVRGVVYPVLSLAHSLAYSEDEQPADQLALALIEAASGPYGLLVDRFLGEADIVIKPLTGVLAQVPEYTGAAIMSDGRSVIIVNTEKLLTLHTARTKLPASDLLTA
jgi:two-component system chemotaxis sensor kinase CheA